MKKYSQKLIYKITKAQQRVPNKAIIGFPKGFRVFAKIVNRLGLKIHFKY